MDPIAHITPYKDTTLALLLAAQAENWSLHYLERSDLCWQQEALWSRVRPLQVRDDPQNWFTLGEAQYLPLQTLDVFLIRSDPPFDQEYLYATQLLELLEHQSQGQTLVVNRPRSLRDVNEKLFTLWFSHCCPPTLVARDRTRLREFVAQERDCIIKPLDAMGGQSIFRLRHDDPNLNTILELMTQMDHRTVMIQRYLPEIVNGDKRILMIDGEPVSHALARLPAVGETRANLAAGGRGEARQLTDRDRWLCSQIGPTLREKGLLFVGLDVIGDFVTEINVTSPTCARELKAQVGLDVAAQFISTLEMRLQQRPKLPQGSHP